MEQQTTKLKKSIVIHNTETGEQNGDSYRKIVWSFYCVQ